MGLLRVSTHSRPKAAERRKDGALPDRVFQHTAARRRLKYHLRQRLTSLLFQHTAARRRLIVTISTLRFASIGFQHTAARRRLTHKKQEKRLNLKVSTHSRPKAAERAPRTKSGRWPVSTHSRPKAADPSCSPPTSVYLVSTHSRPKAADSPISAHAAIFGFQHTAARRRLIRVGGLI